MAPQPHRLIAILCVFTTTVSSHPFLSSPFLFTVAVALCRTRLLAAIGETRKEGRVCA